MTERDTNTTTGRYVGRGPKGYQRLDGRIQEDVCERLSDDPDVDASEVEVRVKNGEVTLAGTVPARYMKRMAEDCLSDIPGVRDITNQLRVQDRSTTTNAVAQQSDNRTRPGDARNAT